jgi:phage shock protein PspC (stress-responsive transcriptional regulator)
MAQTSRGVQAGAMTDTTPNTSPPPPPPPPPTNRPLTRSADHRVIAGVCGGIGEYFHIDPVIVRIAFVLLTVFGGFGVLLYLGAWLLLPETSGRVQVGPAPFTRLHYRNGRTLLAVILIVVAVFAFADSFNIDHRGLLWGAALVTVGVFLLVQERWQPASGSPMTQSGGHAAYAAASFPTPASPIGASTYATPVWTAAPRAQHPRSILGPVTVAAVLHALGVAALLDSAGLVSVSVATGAAIALLIVACGLIAGAWFGRSRALIVLGVLLIPFTAAATLVHEPLTGGTGNVTVAPQTPADVPGAYHLIAGKLTVDLSQLAVSSGSGQSVTATVAFGQLTVVVPPGANLDIHGHVGGGQVNLLGAYDNGLNIDTALNMTPSTTTGTLHLYLSAGFGQVEVVNNANGSAVGAPTPPQAP